MNCYELAPWNQKPYASIQDISFWVSVDRYVLCKPLSPQFPKLYSC